MLDSEQLENICGWCKAKIESSSAVIAVTAKTTEAIDYKSGQFIKRIIFLSLDEDPGSYASVYEKEESPIKEVPVFMIPLRDDDKNLAFKTCSGECAESLRAALESEDYAYVWDFE